jgi:hypothetical protein
MGPDAETCPWHILYGYRYERKGIFQSDTNWGLVWHTDGSKTNEGIETRVYGFGGRKKLSFSVGQYTTPGTPGRKVMPLMHVQLRI